MFLYLKISAIFVLSLYVTSSYGSEDHSQYTGIVQLIIIDDSSSSLGVHRGSAVFIASNTLITAAHIITKLSNNTKENIFFIDSKTKEKVFITKILHLDLKYDLAVLKTGSYYSNTYYPLSPNKTEILSKISLIGFPDSNFCVVKGYVLNQFDFFMNTNISEELPSYGGFSGGAVFQSNTNKLAGIIIRYLGISSYIQYISASKIKQLLSQKPLNCVFKECIADQLDALLLKAQNNDTIAQYSLSHWYKNKNQNQKSLHWLNQAFHNKFPMAGFSLGVEYFLGENVEKDIERAIELYKISAQQGFIPAQYRIGHISLFGIENMNIPINYKDAFDYISMAANNHHTISEYLLGMIFYFGLGREKDYIESAYWIKRAAYKKYPRAQMQLGIMHLHGYGVAEDIAQAWFLINQAAQQGSQEAKMILPLLPIHEQH